MCPQPLISVRDLAHFYDVFAISRGPLQNRLLQSGCSFDFGRRRSFVCSGTLAVVPSLLPFGNFRCRRRARTGGVARAFVTRILLPGRIADMNSLSTPAPESSGERWRFLRDVTVF